MAETQEDIGTKTYRLTKEIGVPEALGFTVVLGGLNPVKGSLDGYGEDLSTEDGRIRARLIRLKNQLQTQKTEKGGAPDNFSVLKQYFKEVDPTNGDLLTLANQTSYIEHHQKTAAGGGVDKQGKAAYAASKATPAPEPPYNPENPATDYATNVSEPPPALTAAFGQVPASNEPPPAAGAPAIPPSSIDPTTGVSKDRLMQLMTAADAQTADVIAKADAYEADVRQQRVEHGVAVKDAIESVGGLGAANANVDLAKAATQRRTGLEQNKLLTNMGINLSDADNEAVRQSIIAREKSGELAIRGAQISQKEAEIGTFANNPLGYVVGHMMLKGDISAYNNTLRERDQALQTMNGLSAAVVNLHVANKTKDGDMLAEESTAAAAAHLAAAKVTQTDIKLKAIEANSRFANVPLHTAQLKLQALHQQQAFLQTVIQNGDAATQRAARAQELVNKNTAVELQLAAYNELAPALGIPPYNSLEQFDRQPKEFKENFLRVYNSSGTAFGETPTQARRTFANSQRDLLPSDTKIMIDSIDRSISGAKTALETQADYRQLTKQADREEKINNLVVKRYDAMAANVDKDPDSRNINLYRAPVVDTMLLTPEIANSTLGKLLADMRKQKPEQLITDEMIFQTVRQNMFTAYKTNWDQGVKDLNLYYRTAMDKNNKSLRYKAWGLNPQEQYRREGVDWTQYDEVSRYLLRHEYMAPGQPAFGMGEGTGFEGVDLRSMSGWGPGTGAP